MASLAEQVEQLKRQVQLMAARIEVLEEQVAGRDKKIRSLELEKQTLLKRLYGPKSDRPSDEAQLMMEEIMLAQDQDGLAAPAEKDGEDPEEEPALGRAPRRKRPTGRQILPGHLEERVEVIDLSPEKKFDPHSGTAPRSRSPHHGCVGDVRGRSGPVWPKLDGNSRAGISS